jgi:hypothetical protein
MDMRRRLSDLNYCQGGGVLRSSTVQLGVRACVKVQHRVVAPQLLRVEMYGTRFHRSALHRASHLG